LVKGMSVLKAKTPKKSKEKHGTKICKVLNFILNETVCLYCEMNEWHPSLSILRLNF
jgi:hypothetical protein